MPKLRHSDRAYDILVKVRIPLPGWAVLVGLHLANPDSNNIHAVMLRKERT
jgi:hypothetical protein